MLNPAEAVTADFCRSLKCFFFFLVSRPKYSALFLCLLQDRKCIALHSIVLVIYIYREKAMLKRSFAGSAGQKKCLPFNSQNSNRLSTLPKLHFHDKKIILPRFSRFLPLQSCTKSTKGEHIIFITCVLIKLINTRA